MKKALILGGTGAMGVHLVSLLAGCTKEWKVDVTSRSERVDFKNVHYIQGNAHDDFFIKSLVKNTTYDVIVDFMNYGFDEFLHRYQILLNATSHYVFLSSSRVYAESPLPITEHSPRLLETTTDAEFLATQRYALRKARQEDMLLNSGKTNFSIIRPYITYSTQRIQLGIYEKEQWLFRLLNRKPLVIRKDILSKRTTLTSGLDVANVLARVMQGQPLNSPLQIVSTENITWNEILCLYCSIIKHETDIPVSIFTTNSLGDIERLFEGGYNTQYDRLLDRIFDNSKVKSLYKYTQYLPVKIGLTNCLTQFIHEWKQKGNQIFLPLIQEYEEIMDEMLRNNHTLTVFNVSNMGAKHA